MIYKIVLNIITISFLFSFVCNNSQAQDIKDRNVTVCKTVDEKLQAFGSKPLARELSVILFEASKKGCGRVISNILKFDVVIDSRDRYANTPFIYAASSGHFEITKFLQSKGANINHINLRGKTALLESIKNNRVKIAKYLLSEGADPNIKTLDNETPLSAAAFNGNQILVKSLLKNNADAQLIDGTGKSAIIYASAKGFANIVKVLLDNGVNVNKKYKNDLTALMWASGHTDDTPASEAVKTIKVLANKGANLNFQDNLGKTALMYAASLNNTQATITLIKIGADKSIKDKDGKIALDMSSKDEIIDVLK